MTLSRREFVQGAAAMGATLAFAGPARASRATWRERRDLFPEGVASGDPDHQSVILWTRRPFEKGEREVLTVEVAEDEAFRHVVATAPAPVSRAADWTSRVLVAGLKPARTYWYRFTDADGNGSRVGRTITAPDPADGRAVNFAFVSCQEHQRRHAERVSPDDLRGREGGAGRPARLRAPPRRLHLRGRLVPGGPEDPLRQDGLRGLPHPGRREGRQSPRSPDASTAIAPSTRGTSAIPTSRTRAPAGRSSAIWDNHEFSWQGWQSIVKGGGYERPGQTVKVAANQAWFEYLPARVTRPHSTSLETFDPPAVKDVKIERFDATGLGDEPNNRIAIDSLKAYRALRYGRHLDLMLTDQHSYRGPDPLDSPELEKLGGEEFPSMFPEELRRILDGGRAYDGGQSARGAELRKEHVREPRQGRGADDDPRRDAEGVVQGAPAQLVGHVEDLGQLPGRRRRALRSAEPARGPDGALAAGAGYANMGNSDWGNAYSERGEIYDLVRENRITGFAIVSGDKHSFWAGYATNGLPPRAFEPVGLSFVGASLSSPGTMEATEHKFPKDHPLRALFLADRARRGAGVDVQHASEARRPVLPGVREERRPRQGARALESIARTAPRVPRPGRTRLCEGTAVRGRDAHGVRVHPAPGDAQRSPRRRTAALSRGPRRTAVAPRRAAPAPAGGPGGRSRPVHLAAATSRAAASAPTTPRSTSASRARSRATGYRG